MPHTMNSHERACFEAADAVIPGSQLTYIAERVVDDAYRAGRDDLLRQLRAIGDLASKRTGSSARVVETVMTGILAELGVSA